MQQSAPTNRDLSLGAALFAVFVCAAFGCNSTAIKVSLKGVGVFANVALRFGLSLVAIFLWAKITRQFFIVRKGTFYHLLIITGIFVVQISGFNLGLSMTNASRTVLIVNLQPFLVLLLAHYFLPGDTFSRNKLLGILTGFAGVLIVFLEKGDFNTNIQMGDLLVLASAVLWAINVVYTKKVIHKFLPFQVAFYPMLCAMPFFVLESVLFDSEMIRFFDGEIVAGLLYQGLVTGAFGFVAWNTLFKKYGAVALNSFVFVVPVAGVLSAGAILDEPLSPMIFLSLALIICGLSIIHMKGVKKNPVSR